MGLEFEHCAGKVIRRVLEAQMRTIPLLAVLFVPIAYGVPHLYLWAQPEAVAASPHLQYQQFYLWFLYAFVHLRYLWSDWAALVTGRLGCVAIQRPRGRDLAAFVTGKAIYLGLALVLPVTRHPATVVIAGFVAISMVMGVIFSVVFQLAHTVDTVEHPTVASSAACDEWVVHQIRTTANFATDNAWVTAALGGLNFQREHHLFPRVSHIHYPELSRIVKSVCAEHHVTVAESPTVAARSEEHTSELQSH